MVIKSQSKRPSTLSDIATLAGVTSMTVSRVVNQTGYVSIETKEKVLHAINKLNYRPNGIARSLKRRRTNTIGLILGDIANPYSAELARAVRAVTSAKNYNLFICVSEQSAKEDIAAFESLSDHNVDGIIVATRANRPGDEHLARMIERGLPIVLIGRDFHHNGADLVAANNHRGGFDATQHLIDLGHKRIGFIGTNLSRSMGLRRFQGYLDALKKNKIQVDERTVTGVTGVTGGKEADDDAPGYSTERMGFEGMKRLLSLPKYPTAVFARNDFTAIGAMTAIKEAGLNIPDDIAIMGFDDIPMAVHTAPPLTTVRQPTRRQGQLAAEFLLRRIEGGEILRREERILECELIVRQSTASALR